MKLSKLSLCLLLFILCACSSEPKRQPGSLAVSEEKSHNPDDDIEVAPPYVAPQTADAVKEAIKNIYAEVADGFVISESYYLSSDFNSLENAARQYDPMAVDWDYWVMAQDKANVSVKSISIESFNKDSAVARIALSNMGRITNMRLWLVYEHDMWKIADFMDIDNSDTTIATIFRNIVEAEGEKQRRIKEIQNQAISLDKIYQDYYSNKVKAEDTYTGKTFYIKAIVEKMGGRNRFGAESAAYRSKWTARTEDPSFVQLDYPNIVIMKATVEGYEVPWYEGSGTLVLTDCELLLYNLEE